MFSAPAGLCKTFSNMGNLVAMAITDRITCYWADA